MGRLLDKYRLVHDGDFLREYAREHNLFIYPYDLETGADIALYENTETKEKMQRYYICSLEEVKPRYGKAGLHEKLLFCDFGSQCRQDCAGDFAGALASWNTRMRKRLKTLQKPFLWRFLALEADSIFLNAIFLGLLYYLIVFFPALDNLLREYAWPFIVMFFICNLENIFTRSYGAEIPRSTLSYWAKARWQAFSEQFYQEAMAAWPEVQKQHQNSPPIYVMWRRNLLEAADEQEREEPGPQSLAANGNQDDELTYQAYCREILGRLDHQAEELKDRQTKIRDRFVRQQVEKILKLLDEIRAALGQGEVEARVIAARKVASYWNEETISLVDNYLLLANNSSREAGKIQDRIVAMLRDMTHVYREELGRITATHTMELKASMEVLQREIDEALSRDK